MAKGFTSTASPPAHTPPPARTPPAARPARGSPPRAQVCSPLSGRTREIASTEPHPLVGRRRQDARGEGWGGGSSIAPPQHVGGQPNADSGLPYAKPGFNPSVVREGEERACVLPASHHVAPLDEFRRQKPAAWLQHAGGPLKLAQVDAHEGKGISPTPLAAVRRFHAVLAAPPVAHHARPAIG